MPYAKPSAKTQASSRSARPSSLRQQQRKPSASSNPRQQTTSFSPPPASPGHGTRPANDKPNIGLAQPYSSTRT
eukprot:2176560-Rhodomonas_salina.1